MGRLAGKTAAITGAANGIGAAAARRFAREGARLALLDMSSAGAKVAEEIAREGGTARFIQTDVSIPDEVEAAFAEVRDSYGRLDVLYNNAGIRPSDDRPVHELDVEIWDRIMGVNIRSMYLCCHYAVPLMLDGKQPEDDASIINGASMAGIVANAAIPSPTAYTVSKGAVLALTKQLAVTYGPNRIRCNAICPGAVETAILRRLSEDPEARQRFENTIPIRRIGQPDDIANLALFLASEESSYITGDLILIDGGYTAL